jgi:hypothetical protein
MVTGIWAEPTSRLEQSFSNETRTESWLDRIINPMSPDRFCNAQSKIFCRAYMNSIQSKKFGGRWQKNGGRNISGQIGVTKGAIGVVEYRSGEGRSEGPNYGAPYLTGPASNQTPERPVP